MRLFLALTGMLALVLVGLVPALAAPTGYLDDCSGALRGWAGGTMYKAAAGDGVVTVNINKQTMWAGQYYDLGGVHDFSKNPYVNVTVKANPGCILHVYLFDTKGENIVLEKKVRRADAFVTYSYDFSNPGKVDLTSIKAMQFSVNGAANSWIGTLQVDEIRVGDKAVKMAGIEAVAPQINYMDSGMQAIRLSGLEHVARIDTSGPAKLVRDLLATTPVNGVATLAYSTVPGASGSGVLTITAVGEPGYANNSITVPLTIEANLPPTVKAIAAQVMQVGVPQSLRLSGMSDGNVSAFQPLRVTVTSDNDRIIRGRDVWVLHAPDSPYATLAFIPLKTGSTSLRVQLDDQGATNGKTMLAIPVQVVTRWNHLPTLDAIPDQQLFIGADEQRISLTGISDGDYATQKVAITVAVADATLIPQARVEYTDGKTATLVLTPSATHTGKTTVTVTIADTDTRQDTNGNQQQQVAFTAIVRAKPLQAWQEQFTNWEAGKGQWRPEDAIALSTEKDGDASVLKVDMKNKITFGGLWLTIPDMDLAEYPYLTVDVKTKDKLQFNTYFYDGTEQRNDGANQAKTIPGGQWTTVTFDFSENGRMSNNKGLPIDAHWINKVLFNMHPQFGWPFNGYTGTLYLRNLRIGKSADIPKKTPVCTLNSVPAQVHARNAGKQQVKLAGISNGAGGNAKVAVTSNLPDANATISGVSADGSAVITHSIGANTGKGTLKVEVTAVGSTGKTLEIPVEVIDADPTKAIMVKVDAAKRNQIIRGFGTFNNNEAPTVYGIDLGASAMRVGIIEEQIEPANDNSDPYVLNRAALDYSAFDFAHMRKLHEAGVETFILTSWSPPAWMKPNLSTNYQSGGFNLDSNQTENRLDYPQYEEFAESMVAAVRMFQEEAGITLTAIGVQNEPTFHEPYASAILDPKHFAEVVKVVGRRFKQEGISTRLFFSEQVFSQGSMNDYIDVLNKDPEAQQYCDIMATHGYDERGTGEAKLDFKGWSNMWQRLQKGNNPKELWMTETYPGYRDWNSAFGYALNLYGSLEYGNIGLWTSWSIEGQLINQGSPNASFYAVSQYWKFIRPGAIRLTSTSADADVLVSSYLNDDLHGGDFVSVLINKGTTAKAVRLSVSGFAVEDTMKLYRTDRVNRRADLGTVKAGDVLLLPPNSITTVAQ